MNKENKEGEEGKRCKEGKAVKKVKMTKKCKKGRGYYLIIRGPLGIGKTTISEKLAEQLNGEYISIDRILNDNKIKEWEKGYISEASFLKANDMAVLKARPALCNGKPAIFDGNFYHKSQIEDLIKKLDFKYFIFTLKAPLAICIERDSKREKPLGAKAAEEVHRKTSEFDEGIVLDTENKTENQVIEEILRRLK
jgi:predicted kinase